MDLAFVFIASPPILNNKNIQLDAGMLYQSDRRARAQANKDEARRRERERAARNANRDRNGGGGNGHDNGGDHVIS